VLDTTLNGEDDRGAGLTIGGDAPSGNAESDVIDVV